MYNYDAQHPLDGGKPFKVSPLITNAVPLLPLGRRPCKLYRIVLRRVESIVGEAFKGTTRWIW